MGGCRCYFRQCHVSSAKFPRMHFFRFPLKESERYKKWLQFSKMEHCMLKFSEVRRKNTGVCARHFRIECFMNYKMDRLAPNAIPTLMHLSDDYAIDFELDVENGVLVELHKTKQKHLIPPDGFESPLFLSNDKILLSILNEFQSNQYNTTIDLTQQIDSAHFPKSVDYEEINIDEKSARLSVNSVEILEAIQVAAPKSKRPMEDIYGEYKPNSCFGNKKCKILNRTYARGNYSMSTSTISVPTPLEHSDCDINTDDLDLEQTDQIEGSHKLVNNEKLLWTSEVFNNSDSYGAGEIEFFEVHKRANATHHELPINDSDTTIVHLKSNNQVDSTVKDSKFLNIHNWELELKKKNHDINKLQVKLSLLESENNELKKICQENEEMNRKLLSLQMENSCIKKDYETVKEKLKNLLEENKKLRLEVSSIQISKTELLSGQQDTKQLENLMETLKSFKSKEQKLKEQFDLELKKERSNNISGTTKLKEELEILKEKLKLTQDQLKDTETQVEEVKISLCTVVSEKDMICQQKEKLEQSLKNTENTFEIKQNEWRKVKSEFENLQQQHSLLEQKHCKLLTLQNQETTVSTSIKNTNNLQSPTVAAPTLSTNSLTKAQLFNGIKRYLCGSMLALLRMEMFGSSEREFKSDERQVAVDILGLGELVYKYFTDEWRLRLPALRDVRIWLSQSQVIDEEEDL